MRYLKSLKEKIDNSGLKLIGVANHLGISREGLYKKLNGETEFKASEIAKLTNLLKLSVKEQKLYFFTINSD